MNTNLYLTLGKFQICLCSRCHHVRLCIGIYSRLPSDTVYICSDCLHDIANFVEEEEMRSYPYKENREE